VKEKKNTAQYNTPRATHSPTMQEHVSLSIMHLRSDKERALAANQTFVNLQPPFNRKYEAWSDKLKTRLIETILLNRAMNPVWTVQNDDEHTEEVMDGVHRVTTSTSFLDNQFSIDGKHLLDLSAEEYHGKRFDDLNAQDKSRIRHYNFFVNILDPSYMDEEKWQEMSSLLNRSSVCLNDFEFKKPIYNEFYQWLTPQIQPFLNTTLFKNTKTSRGKLEMHAMKWLALSELHLPEKFSSQSDIMKKWQDRNLGETSDQVKTFLSTRGPHYKEMIERIRKAQHNFVDEARLLDNVKEDTVAVTAIITRTVALVKDDARISRHLTNLVNKFKTQVLATDMVIHQVLECKTRNAEFQRKLLKLIDTIILEEIGNTDLPRCFPKAMIAEKLREQNNLCTLCKETIHPNQKYEGDHIVGWIVGGETIKDNCQVVHQACHKRKT
jgi:hypothetical protein